MLASNDPALLSLLIDSIPSRLFVVDTDVKILAFNAAAASMLGDNPGLALSRRGGEALHCLNAAATPGGCGASEACKSCFIRNSVTHSCLEGSVVRHPQRMRLSSPSGEREVYLLVTTAPLAGMKPPRAALILEDIGELVSLEGVVPVCMHCRKVRDESSAWRPMESYLKERLDLDVTHGLCPDCLKAHYPEFSGSG